MSVNAALVGARGEIASGSSVATGGGASASTGSSFVIAVAIFPTAKGGADLTGVTDNKSNTYTQIGTTQTTANGDLAVVLFCKENGAGGAGHTATANFANANAFASIYLIEVTGATTTPFDQTAQGNDTITPYTLSSPTLGQAAEVVLSFIGMDTGSNTTGDNWLSSTTTILDGANNPANFWPVAISKLVTAATTAVTPSFTYDAAHNHESALILATFREATASGAISGTAAITFGTSGALTGAGVLTGSSALSFGQTGALAGAGALSGTGALSFGQSGLLAGTGTLAGTSAIVWGASATTDLPAGALAGTAALIFGTSGLLTATGILAGSASLVFNAFAGAVTPASNFSGGFLYEYERSMSVRARHRARQEQLEEDVQALQDKVDAEIALLLHRQEAEDERKAELARLQTLVQRHSHEQLHLSSRAKVAYVRALGQANFSALEALDRELQRQLDEEEATALMILLNED